MEAYELVKSHLDSMDYKYNVSFDYDNQKVVFDMYTESGEHIYIKIVGYEEYTLLIERYSKIGHRSVMKSIGEKYCSTHGYEIGQYGTATAEEIKKAVKSNLDSHERWCSKIQKVH
jgi:hypothetical protein